MAPTTGTPGNFPAIPWLLGDPRIRWVVMSSGPLEVREAVESFLAERRYRVAPFTVENADYLFDALWSEARAAGDPAAIGRLRKAYLDHSDAMLAFFERISRETFGREIAQVLLIHANDLHAALLDDLLGRVEARGYRFVTLAEALEDPAYRTPDAYIGPHGPSWLHRWSLALGLPMKLREEPDPPSWVLEAFEALKTKAPAGPAALP